MDLKGIRVSKIINPFVSIMIPTFRRPELLREAINSAVSQYNPNDRIIFEVVVVDNDSDCLCAKQVDDICLEFKSEKIVLYRNKSNLGMFGNWNKCIELARGEWLTILSDDDLLCKDWLNTAVNNINNKEMIIFEIVNFGDLYKNKVFFESFKRHIKRFLFGFSFISAGNRFGRLMCGNPAPGVLGVLYNKASCLELGLIDCSYGKSSDYHFNSIYINEFGVIDVPKIMAKLRWQVNESLNIETQLEFIEKDKLIRNYLITTNYQEHDYLKGFLLKYSNLYYKLQKKSKVNLRGEFDTNPYNNRKTNFVFIFTNLIELKFNYFLIKIMQFGWYIFASRSII